LTTAMMMTMMMTTTAVVAAAIMVLGVTIATLPLAFALEAAATVGNGNGNDNGNGNGNGAGVQQQIQQKVQQQKQQIQPEAYQQRLVDWIRKDPKGFFHPSILFKRLGSDGNSGPYAMHITQDIPKGTPLIVLPRKYVLDSSHNGIQYDKDDDYSQIMCVTVARMVNEYDKQYYDDGDNDNDEQSSSSSFYAPYLSYLFDETVGGTSRGLLPTSWSQKAKDTLYLILDTDWDGDGGAGSVLEPQDFEIESVFEACDIDMILGGDGDDDDDDDDDYYYEEDKQWAEDANLFLEARGWYDKLIPVVDMLNHINGPAKNVEVTHIINDSNDIAAYASRDISAGEQLQYSYSECMDSTCDFGAIKYSYDTQDIFKDYGFVELYPRRWSLGGIPGGNEEDDEDDGYHGEYEQEEFQELVVEITTSSDDDDCNNDDDDDDDHDDHKNGTTCKQQQEKKVFKWIFETPNDSSILWITEQLARLKSIESQVREGIDELQKEQINDTTNNNSSNNNNHNIEHEMDTILEFYNGYVEVLELALEHKDDPVAITREDFDTELEELFESRKSMRDIRNHKLLLELELELELDE